MSAVALAVAFALSTPVASGADPETATITGEYDGDGPLMVPA